MHAAAPIPNPRRTLLKRLAAAPALAAWPVWSQPQPALLTERKARYVQRLKALLQRGVLPYIDIESSCNAGRTDIAALAAQMDALGIGLMALSSDLGKEACARGVRFDDFSAQTLALFPDRFIPVGNGGQGPCFLETPDEFLAAQTQAYAQGKIDLLGEYEFRHYPSPRQVQRGQGEEIERDVHVPIDGPAGHQLFRFSHETGAPFQIHYEIEDTLLPALEKMLAAYPRAKVIWCHLAQVRYSERATRYTPTYVEGLVQRFPNLYWDTAFGNARSVYPLSGQRHARVWNALGGLQAEWKDLIVAHPTRFLSALDLGGDRLEKIVRYNTDHRHFLAQLPEPVQHQIAYGNVWRLLFSEEFS